MKLLLILYFQKLKDFIHIKYFVVFFPLLKRQSTIDKLLMKSSPTIDCNESIQDIQRTSAQYYF